MYCPNCKNQLKPIYSSEDPLSIECYACFNCGRKYDKSLTEIYTGSFVEYSKLVKDLLRRKPYLKKDKQSLQQTARDELKVLGIELNSKRNQNLSRCIKKILNNKK